MASVKKNYLYNLTVQLLGIILPVVTTPYVTRVLGNENLGIFSYAQSIVNYFILFGCIGLNTYSQREIAACKGDPKRQSVVFYEVLLLRITTVTISAVIYWSTIVRTSVYPLYYSLFGLELFATMVDISWYLQGNENFKSQAIRAMVTRLVGLACIFLFVKSKTDLYIYILCCSSSILLGNLAIWPFVRKMLCPISVKDLHMLRHVPGSLSMFLPQIAINVYTQLDKTMIGLLTNHDYNQVGYYSQAEKIVKIAMTVVTSIGSVMLSRVTIALSQAQKGTAKEYIVKAVQFVFLLACPICAGLMVIARDMVPWFFGPGYDPVIGFMIALSPLVLIIPLGSVIGNNYLLAARRVREYTISVFLGMTVNVCMNLLLIPEYGAMGAVAATLIAEIVVAVSQYFWVRKEFSLSILAKGKYNAVAAVIMAIGVWLVAERLPGTIWASVLEISVGVVIYFTVLAVLRDQFFLDNVKKFLKKV